MMEMRKAIAYGGRGGQRGGGSKLIMNANDAKSFATSQLKDLARVTIPGVRQWTDRLIQHLANQGHRHLQRKLNNIGGFKGSVARRFGNHVQDAIRKEVNSGRGQVGKLFDKLTTMSESQVGKGGRGRRSLYMPPTTKAKMLASFRQIEAREKAYNARRAGLGGPVGLGLYRKRRMPQRGGIGLISNLAGMFIPGAKKVLSQVGLGRRQKGGIMGLGGGLLGISKLLSQIGRGQRGGMVGYSRIKMLPPTRTHYLQMGNGMGYYFPRRRAQRGGGIVGGLLGAVGGGVAKAAALALAKAAKPAFAKVTGDLAGFGFRKMLQKAKSSIRRQRGGALPLAALAIPALKGAGTLLATTLGPMLVKAGASSLFKKFKKRKQRGGGMIRENIPQTTVLVPSAPSLEVINSIPVKKGIVGRVTTGAGDIMSRMIGSKLAGDFAEALALRLGHRVLAKV